MDVCGFCGGPRPSEGDCPTCMKIWHEPQTFVRSAAEAVKVIESYTDKTDGPPTERSKTVAAALAANLPDGKYEVFPSCGNGVHIESQMDGIRIGIVVDHYGFDDPA